MAVINRINLNIPSNRTFDVNYEDIKTFSVATSTPVNIKVVISCTSAQRSSFDERSFINRLMDNPDVREVKVAYNVTKELHIRSPEIINAKSPEEKFIEYAKVEHIEYDNDVIEAIKDIVNQQDIEHFAPRHSFRLLSIELKGSIGIRKGTGKTELSVDFSTYPDGLIAVCGRTGCGKTTLLENCHPYPRMLTRTGTIQSHFELKDSFRKLTYVDESGTYYRISMFIDGKTKNGKVTYLVESGKSLDSLEGVNECDGTHSSYEEWVNRMFGPIELYLRTAFFAKEQTSGIPDISRATKGEKKELFSTLIGLSYIKEIGTAAKMKSSELTKELDAIKGLISEIDYDDRIAESKSERISHETGIGKLKSHISELEEQKKSLEEKLSSVSADSVTVLKYKRNELERLQMESAGYTEFVTALKPKILSLMALDDDIKSKEKELDSFMNEEYYPMSKVYYDTKNEMTGQQGIINSLIMKRNTFKSTSTFSFDETCPTCGNKLTDGQIQNLRSSVEENKKTLIEIESEIETEEEKMSTLEKKIVDVNITALETKKSKLEGELKSLKEEWDSLYIENYKAVYDTWNGYDIKECTKKINLIVHDINIIEEKCPSSLAVSELKYKINEINGDIKRNEDSVNHMYMKIGQLDAEISRLESDKEKNSVYIEEQDRIMDSIGKYRIIEKAFSDTGIQALELEALAPDIADIANSILYSAYGDRFNISFRTLRVGSDGHLIEDFSILIEDNSDGTTEPLEWLSSGESVWIKTALYNSFAIVRMKNTGLSMKVIFADEIDGSLDSESRLKYLEMIKAAHRECNAAQTVLITHSVELKDVIENKIMF